MVNISNFTKGSRAENYSQPTQLGFNIQGNVGAILNSKKCDNQNDLCINNRMNTENESNLFTDLGTSIISNGINQSELLPNYPNSNQNNLLLGADTNQKLENSMHPALYGETTYGLNNSNIMNNNVNNIGHEYSPYGNSNENGSRALPQGKYSTHSILPGYNVPQLEITQRNDSSYVSLMPLNSIHGAGDWRTLNNGNHYSEYLNK